MKQFLWIFFVSSLCFSQASKEKAKTYLADKNFKKAEQEMQAYLQSNIEDKEAIELLGDAFGHQKKWDEAIAQYEKLKDAYPSNANYHYKYGGALGMKALSVSKIKALTIIGDVKEAFLKAAELDPKHIDTRWALVELYVSLPGIVGGSNSKALKYANELEKLSKVDGYLAKGYVYEYDDEPELAEKYYKLAIKVGGSVTCYEKLTNFYETQNKPNEAIGNLEEAQQKHQRNAMHYQIGKVSNPDGRFFRLYINFTIFKLFIRDFFQRVFAYCKSKFSNTAEYFIHFFILNLNIPMSEFWIPKKTSQSFPVI